MADHKPKKGAPSSSGATGEITFGAIVVLFVFVYFLIKHFSPGGISFDAGQTAQNLWLLLPDYAVAVMLRLFAFSFVLSLILIVVIIWSANQLMRIRRQMHEAIELPNQKVKNEDNSVPALVVNEKWQKVLVHINSENPSDWKLAILECDIMLEDILEKMGYMQETIGEKLKSIEPSDFTNIEAAWEAHKIRNSIAHEGSDFMLNEREAKRVIGLYELVFREFEYI